MSARAISQEPFSTGAPAGSPGSGWFADLLYHRLRMAKEIQAHMWISFLEGVVKLSGGRMTGGVAINTERVEEADGHG